MTHTFPCPTCQRPLQVRYGVRPAGQLRPCPTCGTRWWVQTEKHWIMAVPLRQEEMP
jgi:transposase-like protein